MISLTEFAISVAGENLAPKPVAPVKEGPRICMPTARKFTRKAFQCGFYEAQDVLEASSDLELIALDPGPRFHFKEHLQRTLLYRDVSKKLVQWNPGLRTVRLQQDYDVFIAICPTYWDLLYVNAIEGWKDRCKTTICWIDELWAAALPHYRYWLQFLRQFDHVFVGGKGTTGPLSKAIGRPCEYLPGGVDAIRFNPYPNPPERVVDVYSIGRRWEGIHKKLLSAAERRDLFYVYDTFPVVGLEALSPSQHRELFANMAKRSRFFTVAPAKVDATDETRGQIEVGYRYFEGSAAGAVMIGQPPDCEAFREMFDWPEAVIPIQPDGSDILDVMRLFASDPEHYSRVGRRNAAEAALRHDWIYRWKRMFQVSGVELPPGMATREQRLKELADMAANSR